MTDVPSQAARVPAATSRQEPDAHGQAALLLAESILHALVDTKTLSNDDALGIIQTSCEVKAEVAELAGESNGRMRESLNLLRAIFASFATDAH